MLSKEKAASKQKVGILLDIGNSETRVRVKYRPLKGLESVHPSVEHTFSISNHYAGLLTNYRVSPDYMNSDTTILDIDGVRIAHGELVEREFVGAFEYPSGKRDKSDEPITNWTIQCVMLKTLKHLSKEWGIDIKNLDVAFNVYCLLPPEEHEYNKNAIIKVIEGINSVTEYIPVGDDINYTKATYDILCNDIQAFPEGIAAFFGIRVNAVCNKLVPNPDVEKYMKGYCLIIDIGAGTTDLAVMQDGKLKADSRMTIPDAGNHIITALQRNVKANSRLRGKLNLGIKNIESVMSHAVIAEGDGIINEPCENELNAAKEELANALANQIRSYVNTCNVMPLIKGILVVGGANATAVRDNVVVSPALETFLIPKIKQFSDLAELIDIGKRDPRYLNLDGLEAIYITQMAKEAK